MRIGVIARSEARGLANQTHEVCRHLDPERVLLIDPGRDGRFTQHPERYAEWDTTSVRWNGGHLVAEGAVRSWLDGLDVVYSAETPYDLRLPQWAAEAGCGVVVQANPEFLGPQDARAAVTWWVATPWRLDHLPARTRVVSMPVPEPMWTSDDLRRAESLLRGGQVAGRPLRFLHTAGWPAVEDRNGTQVVAEAAEMLTVDAEVVIRGQHPDINRYQRRGVRVEQRCTPDYWDNYRDADVLVLPRRFGGLCLPVLEALAVGLPVVMSDCSPNEVWPGPRVETTCTNTVATRCGVLPLYDVDPRGLAATMDELAANPELVDKLRAEAADWVSANTWEALKPMWLEELARACW